MRKLKTLQIVTLLVLVAMISAACGTPEASPVPTEPGAPAATPTTAVEPEETPAPASEIKRGGVLKVGIEGDFTDLDPAHEETTIDQYAIDMVYEGLVRWDPVTLEPQPLLATSWEISDDGLTYTFYLQEGVKWHNGDDFVADDVKYSVERIIDPDEGSVKQTYLASIESVEVVDDYTVVFHLSEPYAALINTAPFVPKIQNRNFVEANDGHTPRTMMGTGPFMFVELVPDQVLRLESNPDYWRMDEDGQPLPYLDGMEFYPVPDENARVADFLAGVTDVNLLVPHKDVDGLLANPDVVVAGPESMWFSGIWMHCATPPFDDPLVRQAVSWAIDRAEIANVGLFGKAEPLFGGVMPPGHWAATDVSVYDHRDVDKAKDLLAQAGYPEGFEVTIAAGAAYPGEVTIAEMTAAYLQDIGIDATVDAQEWGAFIDNLVNGHLPIFVVGLDPTGDPDEAYHQAFHSMGAYNVLAYSNPQLDALLEEARAVTDYAERKELYRQVEEIVLEDVPQALVVRHNQYESLQTYVKNYVHQTNGRKETLIYVWLDR
jgi:peptide/nickel transport system substrate-binding protein